MNSRGKSKILSGSVVSNAMEKTILVRVARKFKHPKYGKFVTTAKKYSVHDETNQAQIGDEVNFISSRPISKTKKWRLLNITRKVEQL